MKHYDYLEWLLYKEKALSKEKSKEMEEHLYICDNCMDIFLSLIDREEVDRAERSISTNFTSDVMNNIQKVKYKPKSKVEKSRHRVKDIFGYYVAVAAVAVILTVGGFYSGMVDMVPHVAKSTVERYNNNTLNVIFNMSENIVNKTSSFINNFEVSNRKEESK